MYILTIVFLHKSDIIEVPKKVGRKRESKMQKIKIIYADGTAETREIIKRSVPETTLQAERETGKSVVRVVFVDD